MCTLSLPTMKLSNWPFSCSLLMIASRTLLTCRNKKGESGSPCQIPLEATILHLGFSLMKMENRGKTIICTSIQRHSCIINPSGNSLHGVLPHFLLVCRIQRSLFSFVLSILNHGFWVGSKKFIHWTLLSWLFQARATWCCSVVYTNTPFIFILDTIILYFNVHNQISLFFNLLFLGHMLFNFVIHMIRTFSTSCGISITTNEVLFHPIYPSFCYFRTKSTDKRLYICILQSTIFPHWIFPRSFISHL